MAGDSPDLMVLDQALQFRRVTIPSDESLCIGTLMSLDLRKILNEPKEKRMQKVWQLLALKNNGLPSDIIFFEEPRLAVMGWGWAPKSLLSVQYGVLDPSDRQGRWVAVGRGIPTDFGLKVHYGGYSISVVTYADSKPRNPWPGFVQIPEHHVLFRDTGTGKWYGVSDKGHHLPEEEKKKHNEIVGMFPVHDVASTNQGLIVLRETDGRRVMTEGILALPDLAATTNESDNGITVKTKCHVFCRELYAEEIHIYETVHQLALRLRDHGVTDKHIKIYSDFAEAHKDFEDWTTMILEDEEFKASKLALRDHTKEMTAKAVAEDNRFVAAVDAFLGQGYSQYACVLIQDLFNHDFTGVKINDGQVWYVD